MRYNHCLTIFHVSILATLILTLDADGEDSKCESEIKVRRNTVYYANDGQELRIICTVAFCNSSAPTVSWYKLTNATKNNLFVNISSSSHIKTDWTTLKHSEGISFLIFKNILNSDSGQYRCRSGSSVSHTINVSVYVEVKLTTVTWTTVEPVKPSQHSFWSYVYHVVGIMMFVIIVVAIYVTPRPVCRGVQCVRKSKTITDGSNPGSSFSC